MASPPTRSRDGRRNIYTVNPDMLFRHQAQEGLRVGPFLDLLAAAGDTTVSQPQERATGSQAEPGEPHPAP